MSEQSITKRCYQCKQFKPVSEFHKNRCRKDGFCHRCKTCQKLYRKTEKSKTIQKRYGQSEKGGICQKRYRCTGKGRINRRTNLEKYNARHPERQQARRVVNHAIRVGKLPRPDTLKCHYCPKKAKEYHHHKGYEPEHWLDVLPVCRKCHSELRTSDNSLRTAPRVRQSMFLSNGELPS